MSATKNATPLALALLLVMACAPADESEPEEMSVPEAPAMTAEEAEAEVAAVREAWIAAAEADDAAAVAALYAPDAVLMAPDGSSLTGRAAIQEQLAMDFAEVSATTVTPTHFGQSGMVAWESGEFSQTVTSPEGEMEVSGQYTVILENRDGQWQIVLHSNKSPVTTAAGEGM